MSPDYTPDTQYPAYLSGTSIPVDEWDPYRQYVLESELARLTSSILTTPLDLVRLEREAQSDLRVYGNQISARIADAVVTTEVWTNTSAWSGTGTVTGGRMYSATGLTRAAPSSTRWVARTTLHTTGSAGFYAYFGVGSSTAAADLVGIGQGSGSTTASILRGTNISAGNVTIPRSLPTLVAGNYLVTVGRDESHVSFTIQTSPSGQAVWGARVPLSGFPGGVASTIFMSANDTTGGGLNWGPTVIYSELAVPPASAWTVGGTALFGAGNSLVVYRTDPTTSIGHAVSIPGNTDARTVSPMVLFMHQAATGVAVAPWTEARMTNVLSALETAGYILLSSDNGTGITGGGTQDKFGNQAGQDDYAAAVLWARQHFNTGALMLLGPSQGSFFAQNILAKRAIGGISAVATISGGSDLITMELDPAYQAGLRTAYGASSSSDFVSKSAGYSPLSSYGYQFRGVPQRFYVGSTDTTAPPSVQITPFVAKLIPYVTEANIVTVAGVGHLDASLYQGSDLVSFYDKYR